MSQKFTKKPVTIDAVQFTGINFDEIVAFTVGAAKKTPGDDYTMTIATLEGDHIASPGDWIIRGIKGEYYPCKSDIFEATYNPGEAPAASPAFDPCAFEIIELGTQYRIPKFEVIDGVGIQLTGNYEEINFVRGSKLKDEPVERHEGILHEGLLSMILEDLAYKQTLVPSRESSLAFTHIQAGLMYLGLRKQKREKAGVQGTYKKEGEQPSGASGKPIAVSFTLKGQDFKLIRKALEKIKADNPGPITLMHGFMTREAVVEKKFSTEVVDTLDELFPSQSRFFTPGGPLDNMRKLMASAAKDVHAKVYAIGEIKEGVAEEVAAYEAEGITVEKVALQ